MYTKPTFQDILLSLSYRYGESSVPVAGIDNRKLWINNGIEFVIEKLQLLKSVSVTVTGGIVSLNASSAEPAPDFKSFAKLMDSRGNQYSIYNQEDYINAGDSRACCITGNFATGYMLNVKADGDYTLWYRFYTDKLVNTTDVSPVPDAEAISAYAYAQIRMSETDPLGDASKNMDECYSRIDTMAMNVASNEGDLRFKPLF